jgi:hypothetical protein
LNGRGIEIKTVTKTSRARSIEIVPRVVVARRGENQAQTENKTGKKTKEN